MKRTGKGDKWVPRRLIIQSNCSWYPPLAIQAQFGIQALAAWPELFPRSFQAEPAVHLKKNIEQNHRVCVMAVNSGKWFWLQSLIRGQFKTPCSIRLMGTTGVKREATPRERQLFEKLIGPMKWTRGYKLLWKNLKFVTEIHFDSYEWVDTGKMTAIFDV